MAFTSSWIRCAWFTVLRTFNSAAPIMFLSARFAFRAQSRSTRAIASTRLRMLRMRSRTLRFRPPDLDSIFFIVRVSTRAPSPNKLLMVG